MNNPPMTKEVARCIGENAKSVENRSLLLDKFVSHKGWPEKNNNATKESLDRCIKRSLQSDLEKMRKAHVEHLKVLFEKNKAEMRVVTGKLKARLAINLTGGIIENGGICLDRMFGTPYIPGSAVKGVCRHLALERLRQKEMPIELFQELFGIVGADFEEKGELKGWEPPWTGGEHRDQKGCVCFLGAYPLEKTSLEIDITNVHFPKYYQNGKIENLKEENPQPNVFPVVKEGAMFAFFLSLNDQCKGEEKRRQLLDEAETLLGKAIECSGIGAKTGAGYGWFEDLTPELRKKEKERAEQAERERLKEEEEKKIRAAMTPEQREEAEVQDEKRRLLDDLNDEQFSQFAWEIDEQPDVTKKAMGELLKDTKKDTWKNWKKREKKKVLAEKVYKTLKEIGVELPW